MVPIEALEPDVPKAVAREACFLRLCRCRRRQGSHLCKRAWMRLLSLSASSGPLVSLRLASLGRGPRTLGKGPTD